MYIYNIYIYIYIHVTSFKKPRIGHVQSFQKGKHFAGFEVKIILKALILRYWVSLMVLKIFSLKSYTHTARRYGKKYRKSYREETVT